MSTYGQGRCHDFKSGGTILRAERIIPKLCPPVRFGSKSGGGHVPPSSYRSAAHAYGDLSRVRAIATLPETATYSTHSAVHALLRRMNEKE